MAKNTPWTEAENEMVKFLYPYFGAKHDIWKYVLQEEHNTRNKIYAKAHSFKTTDNLYHYVTKIKIEDAYHLDQSFIHNIVNVFYNLHDDIENADPLFDYILELIWTAAYNDRKKLETHHVNKTEKSRTLQDFLTGWCDSWNNRGINV